MKTNESHGGVLSSQAQNKILSPQLKNCRQKSKHCRVGVSPREQVLLFR